MNSTKQAIFLILMSIILLLKIQFTTSTSECDNWRTLHPNWLLCEDFESYVNYSSFGSWYTNSQWTTESEWLTAGRIAMTNNITNVFQGNYSLYMPADASVGYQGSELSWIDCNSTRQPGCTMNGHDRLYIRTYVKFAPDHDFVHHFLTIRASQPNGFWNSMGLAGCRPNGAIHAGTTIDFSGTSRQSFFYTYSPDMHCDTGGYCSGDYVTGICNNCSSRGLPCLNGPECCWGNTYQRNPPALLPRDQWICLEMMMQMNTPSLHDGIMAYWINDTFIYQNSTMYWRTSPTLQINRAALQHFIPAGEASHPNRVWWDNAVISTERIGCLNYTPPSYPSCISQGGNICNSTASCNGNWINANDTGYCCNGNCYTPMPPNITISVDSTYGGYSTAVIDDDIIDAFGGIATTWASAQDAINPHWIAINFSAPKTLNNATIWWAWNQYQTPQIFMTSQRVDVQYWDGNSYQTAASLLNPLGLHISNSSVSFPQFTTTSLRFFQPANMGDTNYSTVIWLTEVDYGNSNETQICTESYNYYPCDCINITELSNTISGWNLGQININQLITNIKIWKSCSD